MERLPLFLRGRQDKKLTQEGIKNIINNPWQYIYMCAKKFPDLWLHSDNAGALGFKKTRIQYFRDKQYFLCFVKLCFTGFHFLILGLGICGFIFSRRKWKELMPFILIILYFTLFHLPLPPTPRFVVPVLPFVIIMASYTIIYLWNKRSV